MKIASSFPLLLTLFLFSCASGGGGSEHGPGNPRREPDPPLAQEAEEEEEKAPDLPLVEQTENITLTGKQVLVIENMRYILRATIRLEDQAQLIIRNALFEHRQEYAFQNRVVAYDQSQVIMENSEIQSDYYSNWSFFQQSGLTLSNLVQTESHIWNYFAGESSVLVNSAHFKGTLDGKESYGRGIKAEINDSGYSEIEFVYPAGAVVNESLPPSVHHKVFPNEDDENLGFTLTMNNARNAEWGISLLKDNDVTIKDATSLVVTFSIVPPWWDLDVVLEGLLKGKVEDRTWTIDDSSLRLVNVENVQWSPIVGGTNSLTIRNSQLNDNSSSSGDSRLLIEDSTTSVLKANGSMIMTVRNTIVDGDVIAADDSLIILENVVIKGNKVTTDNGRIEER